jgi:5-carboxymethyl-2-hydroxymuconate isomerase
MGEGRAEKERKRAGEELMSVAKGIFSELLKSQYFSLSLEVTEINSSFSWKINSIHGRLDLER